MACWMLFRVPVWAMSACTETLGEHAKAHEAQHTIVLTSPVKKDVVTTQTYVSQIHSRRHIELRALERGYLEEIEVEEGQAVNQGQLLFKILPVVYKAKLHGDQAELQRADIALRNTKNLFAKNIVSDQELALAKAERAKAKAKAEPGAYIHTGFGVRATSPGLEHEGDSIRQVGGISIYPMKPGGSWGSCS